MLAAATLVGRNIYRDVISRQASDRAVLGVSRAFVLIIMAASLYIAIRSPSLIVNLLLTAYDGVTQFFPAVVASLAWRRTSRAGAAAGLLVGVGLMLYLVIGGHDPLWGMNAGFIALVANALVVVAGSLLFPDRARGDAMAACRPLAVTGAAGTEIPPEDGTAAP